METRCRLCAEVKNELINVLDNLLLQIRISTLFKIKIHDNDQLSVNVCTLCTKIVHETWQFTQTIQRSQEILNDLLCDENKRKENNLIDLNQKINEPPEETDKITLLTVCEKKANCKSKTNSICNINKNEQLENINWESYPWICYICQLKNPTSDDLRKHYLTVHGSSVRYTCVDCPKVYTNYALFIGHVKIHHTKLKLSCDICFKCFTNENALEKHRNEHIEEKPHSCSTCGKRFRMRSALSIHSRSHLPAELKNKYLCDQCPKKFGTKPNLMAHKRIHSGVRDFTCDQCGKSFVQKGNLENHLLIHTTGCPFSCTICGKGFKTLLRLRKHTSIHSGLKPHKCDVCGREFRERATLKEHHRIHTGAMPYTCEFCGKNFRFKGVLTTHRRQHTGERPYSCDECQHHFTNWPNYNKHMKRRHGINTSVRVRKPQTIPPTGMPRKNPPGTILAQPQFICNEENFNDHTVTYYPVFNLYNLQDEILPQRV